MDPVTLGLLVNAGGLIAKQLMGANRPEYEIPDSARQALAQARILQADKNMPGEQKALEQVGISAANSVAAAREGGNVLEAISAIQGQRDRGTQGILARSEADQRADEERLIQQLGVMAQYEDQKFQMNEFAPYAERQQETRDIIGAMGQNAANLLLSQQTKAATEPVQARTPAPSLLPQLSSKVVPGQMPALPQKGFKVSTNAESEATDMDKIRYLLELLKK